MIRAVLFDLDNTLIDRDAAFRQFCHDWLDRSWPDLGQDERSNALVRMIQRDCTVLSQDSSTWRRLPACDSYGTKGWQAGSAGSLPHVGPLPTHVPLLADTIPDWHHQIWSDAWDEEKRNGLPQLIKPDPGVTQMIGRLSKRFLLAVVTNGSSRIQRAKLRASGLAELFEHVIISGEEFVSKPDPTIFEVALSQLGCRAEDALFVGDDPVRDIVGARNVGMTVAWVSHGRQWCDVIDETGRPLSYHPDYRLDHVTELEASVTCWT